MGWISELGEALNKFKFSEIVYEYEQGLMYRNGVVIPLRKKRLPDEWEAIKEEERQAYESNGGWKNLIPFRKGNLDYEWKKSFFTSRPLNPDRFQKRPKDKILRPGRYTYFPLWPFKHEVVKTSTQDQVLDLDNISIYVGPNGGVLDYMDSVASINGRSIELFADSDKIKLARETLKEKKDISLKLINELKETEFPRKELDNMFQIGDIIDKLYKKFLISCNLNFNVRDSYRAVNKVDDYERSVAKHTLSMLARYSRRMSCFEWLDPDKIEGLEKTVVKEVKKIASDKWGLTLKGLYITDNISHEVKRLFHEGTAASEEEISEEVS